MIKKKNVITGSYDDNIRVYNVNHRDDSVIIGIIEILLVGIFLVTPVVSLFVTVEPKSPLLFKF